METEMESVPPVVYLRGQSHRKFNSACFDTITRRCQNFRSKVDRSSVKLIVCGRPFPPFPGNEMVEVVDFQPFPAIRDGIHNSSSSCRNLSPLSLPCRIWLECRGLPSPSLPRPYALPSLPSNLTPGTLPTPTQLRELLTKAASEQLLRQDPSGKVLAMSKSVWATCADPKNALYRRSARFSAAALEHGALPLLRAYLK